MLKCIIDRLEAEALKFWENHSTLRYLQVEVSGKRTELLLSENWNFRTAEKFWTRYKFNLLQSIQILLLANSNFVRTLLFSDENGPVESQ